MTRPSPAPAIAQARRNRQSGLLLAALAVLFFALVVVKTGVLGS